MRLERSRDLENWRAQGTLEYLSRHLADLNSTLRPCDPCAVAALPPFPWAQPPIMTDLHNNRAREVKRGSYRVAATGKAQVPIRVEQCNEAVYCLALGAEQYNIPSSVLPRPCLGR